MKDYIKVHVSGSGDCNSQWLKDNFRNGDKNIKVRFVYDNDTRPMGNFIISTNYTDEKDLHKVYNNIRGIASHLELI